jgi:hypothetical protein
MWLKISLIQKAFDLPLRYAWGYFLQMGYKVKLQKVSWPTNNTFFVTVPVVLVAAMELMKGEEFEWLLEDKNTLVLRRENPMVKRKLP